MRVGKLRIGWSVVCGIACVLFVVAWLRSHTILYWWYGLPRAGNVVHLQLAHGKAILFVREESPGSQMGSIPLANCGQELFEPYTGHYSADAMEIVAYSGNRIATVPLWLGSIALTFFAIAPWLPWRFSLRTLLIATTIVAVVLGVAIYTASR